MFAFISISTFLSVCMKPSGQSGISSSFYIQAGKYDRPNDVHNPRDLHNEIDIEFVGKVSGLCRAHACSPISSS